MRTFVAFIGVLILGACSEPEPSILAMETCKPNYAEVDRHNVVRYFKDVDGVKVECIPERDANGKVTIYGGVPDSAEWEHGSTELREPETGWTRGVAADVVFCDEKGCWTEEEKGWPGALPDDFCEKNKCLPPENTGLYADAASPIVIGVHARCATSDGTYRYGEWQMELGELPSNCNRWEPDTGRAWNKTRCKPAWHSGEECTFGGYEQGPTMDEVDERMRWDFEVTSPYTIEEDIGVVVTVSDCAMCKPDSAYECRVIVNAVTGESHTCDEGVSRVLTTFWPSISTFGGTLRTCYDIDGEAYYC